MVVCDPKLSKHEGRAIPLWYLKTFGLIDFILLGLFTVINLKMRILRFFLKGQPMTLKQLAARHGLQYLRVRSPNQKSVRKLIQDLETDVVVVMVGWVLKPKLIAAPKQAMLNKHASLLPSHRGLFPYFWAELNEKPQGVSFHTVEESLDGGSLLLQTPVNNPRYLTSMVRFYHHIFLDYAPSLEATLNNLESNRFQTPSETEMSYYSLPEPEDVKRFRRKGGRIISPGDLLLAATL